MDDVETTPFQVAAAPACPTRTICWTVPTTATTAPPEAPPSGSPSELNDQGFQLMREGRFEEALPPLEQAVAGLAGTGDEIVGSNL